MPSLQKRHRKSPTKGMISNMKGSHALSPFLHLELSNRVQQRIEENLKRGLPAEAFTRTTVEFGNEGCYLSLAEVLHINRLGDSIHG